MVTYNLLGNRVSRYLLEDLVPDGNGKRLVSNINTSFCWVIDKLHENQDKVIWRGSDTEMDNYDDTHCFGANFRPISFTSEECTVSTFL